MNCKKCGKEEVLSLGLCKRCYNNFQYHKRKYGLTLQEFVETENLKHKYQNLKYYKTFKTLYEKDKTINKIELAHKVGVSKQTIYTYIDLYTKGVKIG